MSKEKVSLEEFAAWEGESRDVRIHSFIPLPEYVPTDRVMVDIGRIATLARLGRLEAVNIGLYEEQQNIQYVINGVSGDGHATAAGIRAAAATRADSSVAPGYRPHLEFPPGRATIRINVAHPDLDHQILRRPQPWARLLDRGLREGLSKAARQQLLEPRQERITNLRRQAIGEGIGLAACTAFGAAVFKDVGGDLFFLGWTALDHLTGATPSVMRRILHIHDEKYERALIRFMPYDRAMAVRAVAHARSLVTAAK